jgi:hypothetical protein
VNVIDEVKREDLSGCVALFSEYLGVLLFRVPVFVEQQPSLLAGCARGVLA